MNLIPVVAKADTLTQNDLFVFKQRVREVIAAQGIRIYQPPIEVDDEGADHARLLIEAIPFSIIGSTEDVKTTDGRTVKGREYLWGVAEVENEDHCDFRKLRSLLIRTHMLDLISTTEDSHYENYRQQQMETRKFGEPKVKKLDNPKFKEEEEQLRKRFTEQVKAEEARFRQWEQHVSCGLEITNVADCFFFFSLLQSVTVSTRTWRWLTARSSSWRPSWTISKLDTDGELAEDEMLGLISYTHTIFCSLDFFSYVFYFVTTCYFVICSLSLIFDRRDL